MDHPELDLEGPQKSDHRPDRPDLVLPAAAQAGATGQQYRTSILPAGQFDPRHLLDYVRVVYKRRWTAISAFVLVVIATAVYSYTRVPIYQASVRVLIQPFRENFGFRDVTDADTGPSYYQTQYGILRSRSLGKRTLQKLGMWQPAARVEGAAPAPAAPLERSWKDWRPVFIVRAFLTDLTGWPGVSRPVPTVPDVNETMFEAGQIDGFLGGLGVIAIPGSGLVDISYTSLDPVAAARYANAVAEEYVAQNLELKSAATREASDWLSQRLEEQRTKVQDSEQALQRFREQNTMVTADDRSNPVVQALTELTATVTRARTDRIAKEARYTEIRGILNDRAALENYPAISSDTGVAQAKTDLAAQQRQLAQASEKLGPRNPEMVRLTEAVKAADDRVKSEITRVVNVLRSDLQTAVNNENGFAQSLDAQRRQALAMNRGGVELAVLMRDLDSNRTVYDNLMARAKETGLTGEIKTNNVRILDNAEIPGGPIWPNTRKNIQYGVVGGMLLALGLVFFFEYLDNRIKLPDDIKTHLGLAFLGIIPATSAKVQEGGTPLLNEGVPPNFTEAFRAVRTNVLFSVPDQEGARIVMVTSAEPSDGKTMVASNLAISIAQAGQRVLLIDGDLRRPRVHEIFGVDREPGLSNFLVGDAKASEVLRKSTVQNLYVLAAGRIPPNPAELLGSKRFREFLGRLDGHFDWVVIDTPPVMAVTDPAVVAHSVSGVLFVVCADATNRFSARTAIENIESARGHFLGAVLNRVDLHRNAYYYSKYYRRGYYDYYQKAPQEKTEV
jgi:succinoglycan biosynthesis transport protein ExoP